PYVLVLPSVPTRRSSDLLLTAGVVLIASSMWWVVLVGVWPSPKPYIGGSTDGTVLDLVFGYNGLGRIFGQSFGRAEAGGPGGARSEEHTSELQSPDHLVC